MRSGQLSYIDTPAQGNTRFPGVEWCADNGCFGKFFDENRWWAWLQSHAADAGTCRFAVAPDVVGDHRATLARSLPWLPRIRALGYPAAFVAQDGATVENMPWDDFDALFIGGSTEFKLGAMARTLIRAAKDRDKWVHVGRVNSKRRYLAFAHLTHNGKPAVDSCDGTFLTFGPDLNLPELLGWLSDFRSQPALAIEVTT